MFLAVKEQSVNQPGGHRTQEELLYFPMPSLNVPTGQDVKPPSHVPASATLGQYPPARQSLHCSCPSEGW